MKHICLLAALFIIFGATFSTTAAQTMTPSSASGVQDSLIKKYDAQIAKLRTQMAKLQSEYAKVATLRAERLKKLMPTSVAQPAVVPSVKKLADFPAAGKTWRSRFFGTGVPPTNAFKAFYFNTAEPTKPATTAQASSAALKFVLSDGPGSIYSEDFGAYWIGNFTLAKDEDMVLQLSQGRSESRVIIDGRLVYKGDESAEVKLRIPKGTHTMEIEYVNDMHVVDFSASLRPVSTLHKAISAKEIASISHSEIWYAGVNESDASDNKIRLVPKSANSTPKILFLSSYSAVKWDASLLKNNGIKAIVYDSNELGSQVINTPSGIAVYTADIPFGYTFKAKCDTKDRLGLMGCGGMDEFTEVYEALKKLSAKPLTGFAGNYAVTELAVPGNVLTPAAIKDALTHPAKMRAESQRFLESQNIENIF